MRWLTLELIKAHLRIDGNEEDEYLELLGNSAETTVLNYINRDYNDLLSNYGIAEADGTKSVPSPLTEAALMLCSSSYDNRSVASVQNLYTIPYGFDARIKPYIKVTRKE